MAELTEHAARDLGVRIISPDRPGISGSAFQAGRKLVDWPPIVREDDQARQVLGQDLDDFRGDLDDRVVEAHRVALPYPPPQRRRSTTDQAGTSHGC